MTSEERAKLIEEIKTLEAAQPIEPMQEIEQQENQDLPVFDTYNKIARGATEALSFIPSMAAKGIDEGTEYLAEKLLPKPAFILAKMFKEKAKTDLGEKLGGEKALFDSAPDVFPIGKGDILNPSGEQVANIALSPSTFVLPKLGGVIPKASLKAGKAAGKGIFKITTNIPEELYPHTTAALDAYERIPNLTAKVEKTIYKKLQNKAEEYKGLGALKPKILEKAPDINIDSLSKKINTDISALEKKATTPYDWEVIDKLKIARDELLLDTKKASDLLGFKVTSLDDVPLELRESKAIVKSGLVPASELDKINTIAKSEGQTQKISKKKTTEDKATNVYAPSETANAVIRDWGEYSKNLIENKSKGMEKYNKSYSELKSRTEDLGKQLPLSFKKSGKALESDLAKIRQKSKGITGIKDDVNTFKKVIDRMNEPVALGKVEPTNVLMDMKKRDLLDFIQSEKPYEAGAIDIGAEAGRTGQTIGYKGGLGAVSSGLLRPLLEAVTFKRFTPKNLVKTKRFAEALEKKIGKNLLDLDEKAWQMSVLANKENGE